MTSLQIVVSWSPNPVWDWYFFLNPMFPVLRCPEFGNHPSSVLLVCGWEAHTRQASVLSPSQWDPFRSSSPLILLSPRPTLRTKTSVQRLCGAICWHSVTAIHQVGFEVAIGVGGGFAEDKCLVLIYCAVYLLVNTNTVSYDQDLKFTLIWKHNAI